MLLQRSISFMLLSSLLKSLVLTILRMCCHGRQHNITMANKTPLYLPMSLLSSPLVLLLVLPHGKLRQCRSHRYMLHRQCEHHPHPRRAQCHCHPRHRNINGCMSHWPCTNYIVMFITAMIAIKNDNMSIANVDRIVIICNCTT